MDLIWKHHAVLKNATWMCERLAGNIHGDTLGRFADGEWVFTSTIKDDLGDGLYRTKSGTIYQVEFAPKVPA
jgi:hypothetical protein